MLTQYAQASGGGGGSAGYHVPAGVAAEAFARDTASARGLVEHLRNIKRAIAQAETAPKVRIRRNSAANVTRNVMTMGQTKVAMDRSAVPMLQQLYRDNARLLRSTRQSRNQNRADMLR